MTTGLLQSRAAAQAGPEAGNRVTGSCATKRAEDPGVLLLRLWE